jgi:ElaB/YqjD/DUF883 family membrane-anchored ribosome-binding protein
MRRFGLLICLFVVLSLVFGSYASIGDKIKETEEHVKERAHDVFDSTKDRIQAAKDFASAKFHQEKAPSTKDSIRESFSKISDRSQDVLEATKDKARNVADFASDKLHQAKEGAKNTLHNTRDSFAESIKVNEERAQAVKDSVSDTMHDLNAAMNEGNHHHSDTFLGRGAERLEEAFDAAKHKAADAVHHVEDVFLDARAHSSAFTKKSDPKMDNFMKHKD